MKKITSIIAIIAGAFSLLSVIVPMIIIAVLKVNNAAAIGVIGGADGPTAITLVGTTGMGSITFEVLIGILLIVGGIWGLKKCKK